MRYPCPTCNGKGYTEKLENGQIRCQACQGNGTDNWKYFIELKEYTHATNTTGTSAVPTIGLSKYRKV